MHFVKSQTSNSSVLAFVGMLFSFVQKEVKYMLRDRS